jgi:PAS domain S-box-containing protein
MSESSTGDGAPARARAPEAPAPRAKARPPPHLRLAFGSALAALLMVGAASYRGIESSLESDRWVRHTHEVLEKLEDAALQMATLETSARGFVLTGDASYLEPYRDSVKNEYLDQKALLDLTVDNSRQQRLLPELARLTAEKIQRSEAILDLRRTRGLQAAAEAVRDGAGRTLDPFQATIVRLEGEELRLLVIRNADSTQRVDRTKTVLLSGTALGLLIATAAGWSVLRDSARRAIAERALRVSEDNNRMLIDGVQDYGIVLLGPQGEILSWNPGAETMTGRTHDEIVGQNFSRFFPAEAIARGRPQEILRLAADHGLFEDQGPRLRKDGSHFVTRTTFTAARAADGVLRGFSVISRDLTASLESDAKYAALLDAGADAVVVVNGAGTIVLLNLQAEKQFGYRRDELLGQPMTKIIPEGFAERLTGDANATNGPMERGDVALELCALRKDGSEFPVEVMLSPLEIAGGILVTTAIRDVSARKKIESDLHRNITELNRSNEELGQFAYVASHDLQEPLRMVASYTQLLSKRYKGRLDADADEFIAFAVDGANRMQRLIQDLLTYSRVGTKGKVLLDTSSEEALQAALMNLRGAIDESGAQVTHDALPGVMADEMQLTQLFQNLVGNAIKYHRAGVPTVHVSAARSGEEKWLFSVKDNGLGIDPRHFERIFGMFQRLHGRDEFAGTGIGLAICKKIVERHGGAIWVESEPGNGSTFRFDLASNEAS